MFTDICPRCNSKMSIGNTVAQCPYSCYLVCHVSKLYLMEQYKVGKYIVYNVLDNSGMYSQIDESFDGSPGDEAYHSIIMRMENVYLPFYKMTEDKIKTYIIFS